MLLTYHPIKKFIFYFFCFTIFFASCHETNHTEAHGCDQSKKYLSIDSSGNNKYCWLRDYKAAQSLNNRIACPEGYKRTMLRNGSFEDWLRHLPLKEGFPKVKLYNNEFKKNQEAQFAVIDIDVGDKNLQQCADAVMRLKAEYHFSTHEPEKIHFNFTNGQKAEFKQWALGLRPIISGNKMNWIKNNPVDSSYASFKKYLTTVFNYAGTFSLSKELKTVRIDEMRIGDVFIMGGFPGHAVIVVDLAINNETGEKLFMLAQSYMPAQDIHILKNFQNSEISPWYSVKFGARLHTPEWNFSKDDLKRFKE